MKCPVGGQTSCRSNVLSVKCLVDQMSVGQMSVGQMSCRSNVCRLNVCRLNVCWSNVCRPNVMSAKCLLAKCLSANVCRPNVCWPNVCSHKIRLGKSVEVSSKYENVVLERSMTKCCLRKNVIDKTLLYSLNINNAKDVFERITSCKGITISYIRRGPSASHTLCCHINDDWTKIW